MRALSRKKANRTSTLRNLATSLILYEKIKTTQAKAKEVKPVVEHLINSARKNDLAARRRLLGYLFDKNATKKVFEVILPRYKNVKTGFMKEYKLGPRLGDGAEMVILELLEGAKIEEKAENARKDSKSKTEDSKKAKTASPRKTTAKAK
jgi:large subunit ribosomal protein L17